MTPPPSAIHGPESLEFNRKSIDPGSFPHASMYLNARVHEAFASADAEGLEFLIRARSRSHRGVGHPPQPALRFGGSSAFIYTMSRERGHEIRLWGVNLHVRVPTGQYCSVSLRQSPGGAAPLPGCSREEARIGTPHRHDVSAEGTAQQAGQLESGGCGHPGSAARRQRDRQDGPEHELPCLRHNQRTSRS